MAAVYILAGVRTAIGDFGGSLKDFPPAKLGAAVIAEAITRAGVGADQIGHVVMGNVIPVNPRTPISLGWRRSKPAFRSRCPLLR